MKNPNVNIPNFVIFHNYKPIKLEDLKSLNYKQKPQLMVKNINWKNTKSPPIWLWFLAFSISIIGIFILGLSSAYLDLYWQHLAIYNLIIIAFAVFYLIRFFVELYKRKKQQMAGAKFATSIAKIIPILTLIPVLSFYGFSFQNVQNNLEIASESVEKFNTNVLSEAEHIYQDLKIHQAQNYIDKSTNLLKIINNLIDNKKLPEILNQLTVDNICKIDVFKNNKKIASSKIAYGCEVWNDYKLENQLYFIDSKNNNTILTQLPLKSILKTDKNIVLSIFYKKNVLLEDALNRMLNFQKGIKNANITLNSSIIKRQFIVDFTTTILLTLLSVLIIVLKMLERIMLPLNKLSITSNKISKGEYGSVVSGINNSDIDSLINEFNAMSLKIKRAKKDIDNKNLYLETIIKHSAGIIAMDKDYKINLYNKKVLDFLKIKNIYKKHIDFIFEENTQLKTLIKNFKKFGTINETLEIDGALIDIYGVKLDKNSNAGYMLVAKDISAIKRTQKLQAWNEVARRMAHEIKNPLNPIVLSAQRLRNKYLTDNKEEHQVIDKTTKTIVSQVESISLMVSSFAEYGKTPELDLKKYDLNAIIKNSISLYDDEYNIKLDLTNIPKISLDKNNINRVLINLVKNSIEAGSDNITIATHLENNKVVLELSDNGKGFDKSIVDKVFEPYITNKKSGSGLGMAIIQKIITSHNGEIKIDKNREYGAKITIKFKI
jgi:two-component system nitrogen regulation sensor histidine kinase NtrY